MSIPNDPKVEAALILLEARRALLVQKKQLFDLELTQTQRWFGVRMAFVIFSFPMLLGILCIAAYILYHHKDYSPSLVMAVYSAVFVKFLGLLIWTHKAVFKQPQKLTIKPTLDDL